jgi:hypothetical protein
MKSINNELVSKMNEIRLLYIETNNILCELIDRLATSFFRQNKKLQPTISIEIRELIEAKFSNMREKAVDNISSGFYKYFDSIENIHRYTSESGPRRFSKKITDYLENSFKNDQYPTDLEKISLAKICNLTLKQVNNWFTNKRNRSKTNNKKYSYY